MRLHNVTGRDGLAQVRADTVDFAVGSMLDLPNDISRYGLILPPRHLSTWGIVDLVFQQHELKYKV
jgi:hypothetical protein